jgi:hypothetical protein
MTFQKKLEKEFEKVETEKIGKGKHEEFHLLLHKLKEEYLKEQKDLFLYLRFSSADYDFLARTRGEVCVEVNSPGLQLICVPHPAKQLVIDFIR